MNNQDINIRDPFVLCENGKYYLYAPLHGHGIGVLTADSPYGPYRDPLNKPLVWQQEQGVPIWD